jgi:chromosome segregation ATPase
MTTTAANNIDALKASITKLEHDIHQQVESQQQAMAAQAARDSARVNGIVEQLTSARAEITRLEALKQELRLANARLGAHSVPDRSVLEKAQRDFADVSQQLHAATLQVKQLEAQLVTRSPINPEQLNARNFGAQAELATLRVKLHVLEHPELVDALNDYVAASRGLRTFQGDKAVVSLILGQAFLR